MVWCIFIILYIICPTHVEFDITYYYIILILYLIGVYCFFCIKKKSTYLDFDTVFILFCSIEHFIGCLFIGTEGFERIFYRGIDYSVIIKASLLSATGLCSYMVGSSFVNNKEIDRDRVLHAKGYNKISLNLVFILFVICVVLFSYADGYSIYENIYKQEGSIVNNSGLAFQSLAIVTILTNIYCAILFLNIIKGIKPTFGQMIGVVSIFIFAVSLAIVGNRTFFSYIVLPYILCYYTYVKKLNILKTLMGLSIGVIAMYVIQVTRQGGSELSSNFLEVFSDIIIPSQTLYSSIEYVEKFGYNFGSSMLPHLYGCIPGLSSLLGSSAGLGSAEIITQYVESGPVVVGMGTTIIVDVYIAFGAIGTILLMGYLGYFVNKPWKSATTQMLIQCALFSCCVFIGRASYLLPLRFILWSLVFVYILNNFIPNGKKAKNNIVLSR